MTCGRPKRSYKFLCDDNKLTATKRELIPTSKWETKTKAKAEALAKTLIKPINSTSKALIYIPCIYSK